MLYLRCIEYRRCEKQTKTLKVGSTFAFEDEIRSYGSFSAVAVHTISRGASKRNEWVS
jgi:hypothetical protein